MKWLPSLLKLNPSPTTLLLPRAPQVFLLPNHHHRHHLSTSLPLPPFASQLKPKPRCLFSSSASLQQNDDVFEDHAIGDCLVFEEGAFDDPFLLADSTSPCLNDTAAWDYPSTTTKKRKKKKKKMEEEAEEEAKRENLVPEEWREVQAEINLTKKQKRRIAQEIEFNSRVEKKKKGAHAPLRSIDLEGYTSFREAKLAHLNTNGRDHTDEEEDEDEWSGRAAPRNPKWAVYGKGIEDVKHFFESGDYVPAEQKPQGPRKLFTPEEKALLNRKQPDLAAATSHKWLPLHAFAASGESNLMELVLKHNVDINAVDADGLTALHRAIIAKKLAITRYLLKESANPFVQDEDGACLMHYAVLTASTDIVKLLLLYNVNINHQDKDGWTPLHLAVQARRTDVLKLLLARGADRTLKNWEGLTPLELCLYSGGGDMRTWELIKLLKRHPRESTGLATTTPPREALASGLP